MPVIATSDTFFAQHCELVESCLWRELVVDGGLDCPVGVLMFFIDIIDVVLKIYSTVLYRTIAVQDLPRKIKKLNYVYGSNSRRGILPPRTSKTMFRLSQRDGPYLTRYKLSGTC